MLSDKRRANICSQVCKLLRKEREKRGISMTSLGEKAGLSQQSISYVEREMRIPNLDTLIRITDALGSDLSEIIREAQESIVKEK